MEKLNILWTNTNENTVFNMVFMYAHNAKKQGWFDEVNLIIWGASAKMVAENTKVQTEIMEMLNSGLSIQACKACADNLGVSEKLTKMGIEVKYMGQDLTSILKTDAKLLTL